MAVSIRYARRDGTVGEGGDEELGIRWNEGGDGKGRTVEAGYLYTHTLCDYNAAHVNKLPSMYTCTMHKDTRRVPPNLPT